MRATFRLSAAVKPGRFLQAGDPTGLTGLRTHHNPRSQLLYLYGATLDGLKDFPDSSVYKQATGALTRHRLKIVEEVKPAGLEEWEQRARAKMAEFPDHFRPGGPGKYGTKRHNGGALISRPGEDPRNLDEVEWDGETVSEPLMEGPRAQEDGNHNAMGGKQSPAELENPIKLDELSPSQINEMEAKIRASREDPELEIEDPVQWEDMPILDASQISDIEVKIGAGLIEEVIQVAQGELKLVQAMRKSQAWEELEEKPPAGQWEYFGRDTHTPATQAPPNK